MRQLSIPRGTVENLTVKYVLIAEDFPLDLGIKALETHSYSLSDIASAANAKQMNLVFYAGCRNQPFW